MGGKNTQVIVTESPLLSGAIQKVSGIDSMATYGHLFDYKYQSGKLHLTAKNPALIERIGFLNRPNTQIIVATDNDAQGELIAQHLIALTPKAKHSRIHINEVTKSGIASALKKPIAVNELLANEAAYLRLLNLKLSHIEPRGTLTTTSLTLAKSFASRGRLNHLQNYEINHHDQHYKTRLPKCVEGDVQFKLPPPANTRQLAMLAAYNNIQSVHHELQELYQNGRLSYIRTDSTTLPLTNSLYPHHVSSNQLTDSHYAIHNLTPYQTDFERYVYKINESSVKGNTHCMDVVSPIGTFIAVNEPIGNDVLSAKSELMMHLSLDRDAFVSTIGRASERYEKVFFKAGKLNSNRVDEIIKQGHRYVPEIIDNGIKASIAIAAPSLNEQNIEQKNRIEFLAKTKGTSIEISTGDELGILM